MNTLLQVDRGVSLEAEEWCRPESCSGTFASSAWEKFHKKHSKAPFFKERRYLVKEFPELLVADYPLGVLEIGCGTGSSIVPILRGNTSVVVYGCDCSAVALDRATELITHQAGLSESQSCSFHPFLCDISSDDLPSWLCCSACRKSCKQLIQERVLKEQINDDNARVERNISLEGRSQPLEHCCVGGVSIATMIFTLSAIPLDKMHHVLAEVAAVLRPGGWLLFRDYGLYDMAMLRFPSSQRVSDRLYQRQDGTLSYFFSLDIVSQLFTKVGLVEDELHYCCVQLMNRKKQVPMKRVWVHAKFRKP